MALLLLAQRLPFLRGAITQGLAASRWAKVSKVSAAFASVWASTMHSVTGATSTVEAVPPFGSRETIHQGESFVWAFRSQGQISKSYSIDGLPSGVDYSGQIYNGGVSTISGTPTIAGSFLVSIVGWELEGERGASTDPYALILTVLPPASFAAWTAFRQLPEAASGALDDPDHDGLSNLVEYAFGLDPLVAQEPSSVEGRPPQTLPFRLPDAGPRDLSIAYVRRRGDAHLLYRAETSENLKDWTALSEEELVEIDDFWDGVVAFAPPGNKTKAKGYVRVRVELIP